MKGEVRGDPAHIDEHWLTDALEAAGVARGAQVTSVEVAGFIGTGQTGRSARLHLEWDQPEGRPTSLVGKFPSGDEAAKAAAFQNGAYETEWAFYHQLAPTLSIRHPEVYVARYDHQTPDFVLLMEDLRGSRQGDQFDGLTVDQAALAVEQVVGLHAPRWGDPTLHEFAPHRPKGSDAAMMLGMVYGMMVEPFLERLGPGLDADIVDVVRALAPKAGAWANGSDTPNTVVHLDYRPDNFMFGVEAGAPPLVVVDWQTVTDGNAMMDLAYMIGGSFEPAERAAVERPLLDDYRTRMAAAGVSYDADIMWRDYRLASLWGVVMTVIATIMAAQTERGDQMLTVMGQRHGRHALDLDAMALLG
ncbi:MAG: phosphotransferase [Ilumatobacteraceae bacterium]|nr:phosphotransferase [Ilumatobacter sp.]MCB9379684.1 phosphotransferase [Acidimicrobiaceae bacterium]